MVDSVISMNLENSISAMINSVYNSGTTVNLQFRDEVGMTRDAQAYFRGAPISGRPIFGKISLNKTVLSNSSKEYIAATIFHEALHTFSKPVGTPNDHNDIARYYVTPMANALREMFPALSSADAYSLAWGGLETTPYYTNPPSGVYIPSNQQETNGKYRSKELGHG
ncbi:MAG: hypothetical protein EOO38_14100, partial [Cytophagaceae bacterium]